MQVNTSNELVVLMLSDLREGVARSSVIYQELGAAVQDLGVKSALQARVLLSDEILGKIDECFTLIGQKPAKSDGYLYDAFVDDFRRELAGVQSPESRPLFVLAKASQLTHVCVGEYLALIALTATTSHFRVGVLLDTCLEDELAFVERNQRLIRERLRPKLVA